MIPTDRRILVWLKPKQVDYGTEQGWFTAQYCSGDEWRIGLRDIEGCSWVRRDEIAAWRDLPEDLQC